MVSFEDASLDQVIAVVNRSGGARIVLADPALAKLRFTGTFDPADGEQLARLVAASFGLQLSRGEGGTLVLAQPRSRPASDEKIPG
jgi:transmembrane sensor